MSNESKVRAYPGCLMAIGDELSALDRRLRTLLTDATPTPDVLAEIITIYSDVSYLFVYLEGNQRHIDYGSLLRYRDAFFRDQERADQVLNLLSGTHCPDPVAEAVRRTWVAWWYDHVHPASSIRDHQGEELYAEAQQTILKVDACRAALLRRLGARAEPANATAAYFRMVSVTDSPTTRSKLVQAWDREQDREMNHMSELLDAIIAERRLRAASMGYDTVVTETFQRCSVSVTAAWEFVRSYLARSIRSYSELAANIRESTGCSVKPMDHFGYYLRMQLNGAELPLFDLDASLDYLLSVARQTFGIIVDHRVIDNPDTITISVRYGATEVGTIRFDVLDTGLGQVARAVPRLDAMAHSNVKITCPTGHVLCRFQRGKDGIRRITFESAHSLFHEFGHAVNHLLIRKRLPNQSGLEYLPLERLENLSMWFEKWVYHPQFAQSLSLTAEERAGLALCQRIKRLEFLNSNLESAVTAALDFDVHRHMEGGLAESFQRLNDEFAIANHVSLGRLLHFFAAPMFRANPGAGLVYIWGAADSAERFAPFAEQQAGGATLEPVSDHMLRSYIDPSEPSSVPNLDAVFNFFGAAI